MSETLRTILALCVDGISYGMILFLISSGLAVTLGLMRVVNLAHGAFAMVGGYVALASTRHFGTDFVSSLLIGVIATAALGAVLEKTLYQWVYQVNELGQMLMTLGLTFIVISLVTFFYDTSTHTLPVPTLLAGSIEFGGVIVSKYRSALVLVACAILLFLWFVIERTDFGMRLRASVDNPNMARAVGIDVARIFTITMTAGCALAAIGGILGTEWLALQPFYPLKYLVPVLTVVAVGGLGSLKGTFIAALVLGLGDTFGRYFLEVGGGFLIYALMGVFLVSRPRGLFARRQP